MSDLFVPYLIFAMTFPRLLFVDWFKETWDYKVGLISNAEVAVLTIANAIFWPVSLPIFFLIKESADV